MKNSSWSRSLCPSVPAPPQSRIIDENGIRRRVLFQRPHRALVPQHLQPCACDQGAGDRGDIVAAREKAIQVMEKLRALRLTKPAELAEAAVEETLT
jgi:hypothetical protein